MSELVDKQAVLKVIREMPYIGLMEKEALLDAVKGIPTIPIAEPKVCRNCPNRLGASCKYRVCHCTLGDNIIY